MTADLTLSRSAEQLVTHVEGNTDAGIDFVDSWNQAGLLVVDAGRVTIEYDDALEEAAREAGLTVERDVIDDDSA